MATTAVGLFENQTLANEVAHALEESGFARNEIRILSEPLDMPLANALSTPGTEFSLALSRDLRDIGATEAQARAYVLGVRQGGVLVFATGSAKQVEAARGIMNRHKASEVEEVSGSEPILPNLEPANLSSARSESSFTGRVRSSVSGARIFVW